MRTLAIGDIHGCFTALETLLDSLELVDEDRLIFLGDYVDRGPNSRGTVEKLIELSTQPRHVFLRGNHDDWLLEARVDRKMAKSWFAVGGRETLQSYGASTVDGIPPAHWEFLKRTRPYFHSESHIFAHAAVSKKPSELQEPRWLMWGNFSTIEAHPSGNRIIVGHSAQRSGLPLDKGFVVCIDTYCYGGGWLSALDVESNEVFQANQIGESRKFLLSEMPK